MKTLFSNALLLLRRDDGHYFVDDDYLLVDDTKISFIGKTKPLSFDKEIDMSGKLIMPGLINAHGHAAMTLLRGVGTGLPLDKWLNDSIFPIEDKLTPSDCLAGNRLACLEMIRSGTTTFSDMYMFTYTTMQAAIEAGLNANIDRCVVEFDPNNEASNNVRFVDMADFVNLLDKPSNARLKYELQLDEITPEMKNALLSRQIIPEANLHSEYITTDKIVDAAAELLSKNNASIHIHVSETKSEHDACIERNGVTPVRYFYNHKILLNSRAYLAHCVYVTDEDLDLMQSTNTSMIFNPSSNMKLGSGFARIKRALDKGVNVALGTDGPASNDNLDMFDEMHVAALISNGSELNPSAVSVDNILDMATINGAKALNRNNTGILKVGYMADLIAIDLNQPHLTPAYDIPSLLVYSVNSSDVTMTMARGKMLYLNGEYLTLNKDKIIAEINKIAANLR